jgi:hypothetical protein
MRMTRDRWVGAAGLLAALAIAPAAAAAGQEAVPAHYRESWAAYQAMKAKAGGGTRHTQATLPDWSGVWRRGPAKAPYFFDGESERDPALPSHTRSAAALTPKYKAAYEAKVAKVAKGIEWDRTSYCLPIGMPRWFAGGELREWVVTPTQAWLLYEQNQEVRRVYTDGRGHIPEDLAIPLWEGDSIGFWDRDTLVVHTTHMKAGEYNRGQPDYSFKVSTVERIRKVADNAIEIQVTVYDPESLLKPYPATFRYLKMPPDVRADYTSCNEANNVAMTPDGGTTFILPGEPGYRDPSTIGIPEVALDSLPE